MKEKELVIIPIVNMSYLLKGAKADFDYFFPELPEKPMTRKQMQKFAQGIKKSVRPDGKSYEKCISINEKRRNELLNFYKSVPPHMPWYWFDTASLDDLEEVVNWAISDYPDHEIWLLYLTKDHEKFNDTRPLLERFESNIDRILVYTDRINYTNEEFEAINGFPFTHYRLEQFIMEHLDIKNRKFKYSEIMIPYYMYCGAEWFGIGDTGNTPAIINTEFWQKHCKGREHREIQYVDRW